MWEHMSAGQKVYTMVAITICILGNLTLAVCGGFVVNVFVSVFCAYTLNIQFNLWCEEYEH